jgi:hypothetical protein
VTYTHIKHKQARDIEPRDIVLLGDSRARLNPPQWRMVVEVFRSRKEAENAYSGKIDWEPLASQLARIEDVEGMSEGLEYVVLRYLVHEKTDGANYEDETALFWAYDLIEVQSQKAAEE